jgi:hypothetical protein
MFIPTSVVKKMDNFQCTNSIVSIWQIKTRIKFVLQLLVQIPNTGSPHCYEYFKFLETVRQESHSFRKQKTVVVVHVPKWPKSGKNYQQTILFPETKHTSSVNMWYYYIRYLCMSRRHIGDDTVPFILNFGTRRRWVVSLTPRPIYPRGICPRYALNRRLNGYQSRADTFKKRKIAYLYLEPNHDSSVVQPAG